MGAFSGLKEAKRGFSSNPIKPGTYLVRLDSCDFYETRTGEQWKNTLTVLATDAGENKPGEIVNTFFSVKHGKDVFQQNLKSFLCGVLGVDDDSTIGEAEALRAKDPQSEDCIFGLVFKLTATERTSKNKNEKGENKTYVVYTWGQAMTPEEIRAAIGEDGVARFFPNGL